MFFTRSKFVGCPSFRRYSFLMICLFISLNGIIGQVIGNEWINYNAPYWKFKVSADGWYRITYSQLQAAGFPVDAISPADVMIMARGQEIHLEFVGQNPEEFNPGDEIRFRAHKNDGWLDAFIYDTPANQANQEYSLFNDTATYFISYESVNDHLRTGVFFEDNYSDFSPHPYCLKRIRQNYHSSYLFGEQDAYGISLPYYQEAEGWFDDVFGMGSSVNKDLPTPHAYLGGDAPNALVNTVSASASMASGLYNHHLQVGYGINFTLTVDTIFMDYQLNKLSFNINPENLGSQTTRITHRSINDLGVASDFQAVSSIEILYAHEMVIDDEDVFSFELSNVFNTSKAYIELDINGMSNPRLFVDGLDFTLEIGTTIDGSILRAIVPFNGLPNVKLLLISDPELANISGITPVTSTGFFTNYAATPLDSAFVMITHPLLWSAATNYASYRELQGMDVLLVNVEELYMQYSAGIWKHPLAIRRFCNDLIESWPSKPSHLFLAGKSIHEMRISGAPGARNNLSDYARNLVPTWGYPSSDLTFTSGLGDSFLEAEIPVGRLACESINQLSEYLNKVVEHEQSTPEMWQKNVLHFGGGGNDSEQSLFAFFLNNYRDIVQDTCEGGKVYTFLKNTTDPVQINLSDSIQHLIEEGVVLMTFFGHASSTGFDQNIDSPQNYDNQGKYPLLIGNSCYTGNIHLSPSESTSENFVLVPDRGVIGFIAKSDLGQPGYLNDFTFNFYKELFQKNYGSSIGQCMKYAVQDFQGTNPELARINTALTFSLHGDPAVTMHPREKTDYAIEASDIVFYPGDVTAQVDSFVVKVAVSNPAKATNRQVGVELIRHYPNGADSSYIKVLDHVYHRDTVYFTLPIDPIYGVGLNSFDVLVDYPSDFIDELENVSNNIVLNKQLQITSGDLVPVWPYEFAIVPDNDITLEASTAYSFEESRPYIFQIDTTDTFDSPFMLEYQTEQSGGVVEWDLPFSADNEKVYYWRCASYNSDPNQIKWRESSFQHIAGKEGWSQAHIFQIENNGLDGLEFDRENRQLNYYVGDVSMKCEVYGNPESSFEAFGTRYQLDLEVMDYSGCGGTPALMVAVIDSLSLHPWETNYNGANPQNEFGNLMDCSYSRNRPEKYFIFRQNDASEMLGFEDMITNHVPDGSYLLIYTWIHADYDGWQSANPGVFDVFQNLGASQIGLAQDSVPFILFTKVGHPETLVELYGQGPDDYLILETLLTGTNGHGQMYSPLIGPSLGWEDVSWNYPMAEEAEGDTASTSALGITINGLEVPLFADELMNHEQDIQSSAPIEFYPYLKLRQNQQDLTNLTPPPFERWQVYYQTAPEVALDPQLGLFLPPDTVSEGEQIPWAIAISNISQTDMDSLLVTYWLEDATGVVYPYDYSKLPPLASDQYRIDTIYFSSVGHQGLNHVWIDVNPLDPLTGMPDQPEQYHFNNVAKYPVYVQGDIENPILDVTFDGIHILNGDIVSAQPEIRILLDDESTWFIVNEPSDTALFKVFLTDPMMEERLLSFSGDLLFEGATDEKNRSYVIYSPLFTKDGIYRLRVQARDKSGNASADIDYQISFEVITHASITEVLNYPNPFSTSTQFAFTITGTEVPDEMKIQIMTVGGEVVREIMGSELGPLHVGRNLTSYRWNATDEFGDRLANGVYLYRVVARLNGQDLETRSTEASAYFNRGFGKMVIIR